MEQKETTISLAIDESKVDKEALYFIDWQKVKNVNDLLLIIASLGMSFSPTHPAWEQIKFLADLDRPIKQGQVAPEMKELKLPKLKVK
jgi:hypothetical protein